LIQSYLENLGFIVVPKKLNYEGFASWLMPLGCCSGIAIDIERLREWARASGLPIPVQKTRVMVHELAHWHFHDRNHRIATAPQERIASAPEEEQAWVFTFQFFALLAGHYSKHARPVCGDNTPARFL
jgi:hypothetical protein